MKRPETAPARAARILGRAAVRRCPNCGGRNVFRSYLRRRRTCPDCDLWLDRGAPDFFIGAYTINLIAAELLVVAAGVATAVVWWPDVPWTGLMYGLALLMVVAPIALYPFSLQLWLGVDLIFRPPGIEDFSGAAPVPPAIGLRPDRPKAGAEGGISPSG